MTQSIAERLWKHSIPEPAVGALIAFALLFAVSASKDARAQDDDMQQGHAEHHDVYKTWCQPGREKPCPSYYSCCNEKKDDGTGDCFATEAELRNGHWWARLYKSPEWIEVPDDKVIREINPDPTGTRGHLCVSAGVVLCWVPPFGGG